MLRVQFQTCEYKSHRRNDYDCAAISWVNTTLTEVPDSRDRTSVPLVLQTRISKACSDLTVQCNYCYPHKWKLGGASGAADRAAESKGVEEWPGK
jgi:hypothetical protein